MLRTAAFTALFFLGLTLGASPLAQDTSPPPTETVASDVELPAMIGQMIMVGFEGNSVDDPAFRKILEKAQQGRITGVLYLQRNIAGRGSVRAMNKALQQAADRPLLVAIDQEGGSIQRVPASTGFPRVPSARSVASKATPREAYEAYSGLASYLRRWGFNLNLGPVADLDLNPSNPIIGRLGRSFSADPSTVVQYSAAFVESHREHGVLTALKHFPGHGSSRRDSHNGWADVTETSKPAEVEVFRRLISQGYADLVMSGHTYDAKFQTGTRKLPASLEPGVIRDLLRRELGFRGAVISDDLQMEAIAGRFSLRDTVISAVLAGNDIIVFGNAKSVDPDIDAKATAILKEAAVKDARVRKAIVVAYGRVVKLKSRLPKATGNEPL
ncbi:glycoside hydrolase family 3 protein [Pararhizobium sp. BT-229]|uniref:glycoside hydrolase family 3 N-terminal domain-containing protein n=1 Tax=Pararhizobium sp. BT-229 TaxID=2986923 RepID=UPI0021F76C91|nr:glycoside hydrolase family 3 N-terminal domain-containing protein [Pararhizobium sp. BT-229]MCV9966481.1 glycoside hydrolase family 3 protein [Pararhizobium sp. BT-229]